MRGVSGLLDRWRQGDRTALDRLLPLVYADLRRMAEGVCVARQGMLPCRRPHSYTTCCCAARPTCRDFQSTAHLLNASARMIGRFSLIAHALQ